MRKAGFLFAYFLLGIISLNATDKGWVEVRSPHFRVLTDHSEEPGQVVALGLEQIRAVFAESMPGLRVDSNVETLLFAARDKTTMRRLLPESHWRNLDQIGGMYLKGSEVDYALMRLNSYQPQSIIYHEYLHKLLHMNYTRLPRWLDEGLAEFFANAGMHEGKAYIGMASPRLELLVRHGVEPVEKIVSYDYASERTWDRMKLQTFYAESWALTHYLMLGEGMGFGDKMNRYLRLLHDGTDPKEGFLKIFGEPKNITKALSKYTGQRSLPAVMIPTPPRIDASKFVVTRLTGAQMSAELGGYYMRQRRLEEARDKVEDALKEDPKNWLAHENLGFVGYAQGKEAEAITEWDAALALNPKAVLSLYYRNVVDLRKKRDAESVAKLKDAMDKVLEIAPEMTAAEMMRSRLLALQGDVEKSLSSAKRVLKLEPDLAGYFLNYAEIELLRKNYAGAIKTARWVAARWSGSDRAEALELADRARRMGGTTATEEEKSEEAALLEYTRDSTSVRGTIESVACQKDSYTLAVQSGEKKYFFRGSRIWYGWSDTLGLSREHFDPCYHATGLRVLVRAKSTPTENQSTEMSGFELRDGLLPGEVE